METPKLDYKRLINMVRERRELYDNTVPDYRNRDHISNIWVNIANELRTNVMDVKAKWQMLRCNYMREKKKVQKRISEGSSTTSPTSWSYFYMLKFLDAYKDESLNDASHDHIVEHNISSNSYDLSPSDRPVNVKHEFLDSDTTVNGTYEISDSSTLENRATAEALFTIWKPSNLNRNKEMDTECNGNSKSSNDNISRCLKNNRLSVAECSGLMQIVRVEVDIKPSQKRKLSIDECSTAKIPRQTASPEPCDSQNTSSISSNDVSTDSDQQFFNSLLPFVKALSPMQNLEFRSGVINFLLKINK